MTGTKNYGLTGVGSDFELGEDGPRLKVESGQIAARSSDGTALVKLKGATGDGADDFVTLSQLNTKQDSLVSGTSIKTVQGQSILGSGDLSVIAGDTYQIQYNVNDQFGASQDFIYDPEMRSLKLLGTDTEIVLNGVTNTPALALSDQLKIYSKSISGRMYLKWSGHSGLDVVAQPNFGFNRISLIAPNTGTSLSSFGLAHTIAGTASHPALASTNYKTQLKRVLLTTQSSTNRLSGIRSSGFEMWRGNASGRGGFFFLEKFALDAIAEDIRSFHGLYDISASPTNIDPLTATTPGKIGMATNSGSGNWSIVHNLTGASPTVINLGSNFPVDTTTVYELIIFTPPNGSSVMYQVTNSITGTVSTGTITTNLPANTSFLAINSWITNNATSGQRAWSLNRMYLESDN